VTDQARKATGLQGWKEKEARVSRQPDQLRCNEKLHLEFSGGFVGTRGV